VVVLAVFAAELPLSDMRLATTAAFVPAVLSAAIGANVLTGLLFYLQYRLVRQSRLALLALAYASSAVLTTVYMLTFPGVFSPGGLLNATPQTAAWLSLLEREVFGLLLIAFACADRFGWQTSRGRVRALSAGVGVAVIAIAVASIAAPLPLVIVDGRATWIYFHMLVPVIELTGFVAIGLLLLSGLRTVTQVWMIVVALMMCCEMVSNSVYSGARYTLGWYSGRAYVLLGASVMLAVFIVKINDLMLRLTRRNRALTERTEIAELEAAEGELRYRSLANVVPQLIWTATATGEIDYVNDRWVDFTGLDVRETRRSGWLTAFDERGRMAPRVAWAEALRQGRPFGGEYRLREAASGRLRWFLVDVIPMHDESGTIVRWIGSSTDIDRSKRTEEREAFLAASGDRLSASLDLTATLTTIADVIIGPMALWARVDLYGEDGHCVNVKASSTLATEESLLRPLHGLRVGHELEALFGDAIARGEPVVEYDIRALAAGMRGLRGTSAILVPLMSGDAPLGVLTLVTVGSAEPDAEDLAVARDFGRRAAQALDHARRFERERTTADSFQRAMLPQVLPELDNVSFSASYSAASETRRVGGDFYDAFALSDGRVALTIGDVTGHGLEAAVIMGEIRQSLRAAASFEDVEPSSILDRASRLLVGSGRAVFVTAVFGVLDPRSGLFEYATAGHPSPVVFDGARTMRLAGSGLPIGLREGDGVDFTLTLPPGCTIVLYTDGLIEFARDLDEGERRLDAAIAALDISAGDAIAGGIMQRVLGSDTANDDIAILTATIHSLPAAAPEPLRRWRFASNDNRTGVIVRHDIGRLVAVWSGTDRRYDGELAFGEVFSNVVRHAPGIIDVEIRATARGAELVVLDRGAGFVPRSAPADTFAESGRGLDLVRAVADDMTIDANAFGGTTITIVFERAERSDAEPWRSLQPQGENSGRS